MQMNDYCKMHSISPAIYSLSTRLPVVTFTQLFSINLRDTSSINIENFNFVTHRDLIVQINSTSIFSFIANLRTISVKKMMYCISETIY